MGLAKYYEDICETRENNILMSSWKHTPIVVHPFAEKKNPKSKSHHNERKNSAKLKNEYVYIPELGVGTVVYTSGRTCKVVFASTVRYCSHQKLQKYLVQSGYGGMQ